MGSSTAAHLPVIVNGTSLGIYANVEHPDKRFLRTHVGHDDGWLFKKSGFDDGMPTVRSARTTTLLLRLAGAAHLPRVGPRHHAAGEPGDLQCAW